MKKGAGKRKGGGGIPKKKEGEGYNFCRTFNQNHKTMKRLIFSLILILAAPFAESSAKPGYLTLKKLVYVQPSLFDGGAPCIITYCRVTNVFKEDRQAYDLDIFSTWHSDEPVTIEIGRTLEEALLWLENMEVACSLDVGSQFAVENNGMYDLIKRTHRVKVCDRRFSSLGDTDEKGSSLVFFPQKGVRSFGVHGVSKKTLRKLRKKLEKAAKEKGLE